jgi:hypothetical protein
VEIDECDLNVHRINTGLDVRYNTDAALPGVKTPTYSYCSFRVATFDVAVPTV